MARGDAIFIYSISVDKLQEMKKACQNLLQAPQILYVVKTVGYRMNYYALEGLVFSDPQRSHFKNKHLATI
ncbi:hypothetical protein GCE9029_03138 [Grimontia celer]|uniref:Uncharacterized protein n=1 Tax=Grimontia celer TaxID=1796497 RepID=A0A128F651_9GAMM|nr:hypothetical protein GCE9029_03138 [Grimontia celer]